LNRSLSSRDLTFRQNEGSRYFFGGARSNSGKQVISFVCSLFFKKHFDL